MQSPIALLHNLQQAERRLAALQELRIQSPEARAAAELAARQKQFAKLQAALTKRLDAAAKQLRSAELEHASAEEAVNTVEGRLYGGEVTSPKELAQLEERLRSLREALQEREGNVYSLLEQVERLKDQLQKVDAGAAKNAGQLEAARARLAHKESEWELEAEVLHSEVAELRKAIPPELLDLYERKKATTRGEPVALVRKGICQGCHMELPASVQSTHGRQLVTCEQCGRILHWPE